jgi:hypothetical protein
MNQEHVLVAEVSMMRIFFGPRSIVSGLVLAAAVFGLGLAVPAGAVDYSQLLYVKTTNYGVTWSNLTRAGDLSLTAPTTSILGDLSACIMNNNELCYTVFLPTASPPGIYACAGPTFTPILAMAEGSNNFHFGFVSLGWTDIGRTPNGDLFIIIWGRNTSAYNTFWGV